LLGKLDVIFSMVRGVDCLLPTPEEIQTWRRSLGFGFTVVSTLKQANLFDTCLHNSSSMAA
jgi:hypothetical protein